MSSLIELTDEEIKEIAKTDFDKPKEEKKQVREPDKRANYTNCTCYRCGKKGHIKPHCTTKMYDDMNNEEKELYRKKILRDAISYKKRQLELARQSVIRARENKKFNDEQLISLQEFAKELNGGVSPTYD